MIPGLGNSGGFEMVLEARGNTTYQDLQHAVDTLMYYASQRPEFTGLASSMQGDIPQLYFDVDRDKAQLLGVSMSDIFSTMKAFTGSIYVNDFNMFNRIYRVYIQAEAPYRAQRDNLNLFFRPRSGRCDDSDHFARNDALHDGCREYQAFQHVQFGYHFR